RRVRIIPLVEPVVPPQVCIVGSDRAIPSQPGLFQNYPNPFNPTTRIRFSSTGENVRIRVFDSLGQEVRSLVDGSMPAGEHEVLFDGSGLPSGMYYYRIETGSFQEVKSMMLVK